MEQRRLGDRNVSAIGLGTMSFGGIFGPTDEAASLACLDAAADAGISHFDTADIYGMGVSERIIGKWGRRDIHLATKCGIVNGPPRTVRNDEAYIRQCLEASLRRLGREHVDLASPKFRSRIWQAPWGGWSRRERSAATACPRSRPRPCAAPMPSIR